MQLKQQNSLFPVFAKKRQQIAENTVSVWLVVVSFFLSFSAPVNRYAHGFDFEANHGHEVTSKGSSKRK